MAIESAEPHAVAGRATGGNVWSACACQGATVGSQVTLIATYPAKALDDKLRVRGVALETRTSITLAPPKLKVTPPVTG